MKTITIEKAGEIFSGFLFLSILFSGCKRQSTEIISENSPVHTENVFEHESTVKPDTNRYTRICILFDKTGSTANEFFPNLEHIQILIEHVKVHGGEIAAGIISSNSEKFPFRRIAIEKLPVVPVRTRHPNNFIDVGFQAKYDSAVAVYQNCLYQWHSVHQPKIDAFIDSVNSLLEKPRENRSDVAGALDRAAIYFTEPVEKNSKQILLIISDLKHTEHSKQVYEIPNNVQTIVINGIISDTTVIKIAIQHHFESFQSAVAFIINN